MALSTIDEGGFVPVKLWAKVEDVEVQALNQLVNISKLPWAFHHVAVMPDVHFGKGATVGSVIAMKDAVSPAAVGVDIGCGMGAIQTNLRASDLPDNLGAIRAAIEAAIPVGFNSHCNIMHFQQQGIWTPSTTDLMNRFENLNEAVQDREQRAAQQLGTLGGGNHFIELCLDTLDNVWMMLHSGSRNIGKELAEIHINKAKKLAHNADLPDPDLAVFLSNTPEMAAYRHDLMWAQEYAMENRRVMFELYRQVLKAYFPHVLFGEPILCHHNYVSEEFHYGQNVIVTRKGAISANKGQLGIIPGSMGTRSYIVRGRGNPESFNSASHGAGRKMSRGAAKRNFTMADFTEQTKGVECRKDAGVLDEIPGAYKKIEEVMENQKDLVEVVHELRQVLCVKG